MDRIFIVLNASLSNGVKGKQTAVESRLENKIILRLILVHAKAEKFDIK